MKRVFLALCAVALLGCAHAETIISRKPNLSNTTVDWAGIVDATGYFKGLSVIESASDGGLFLGDSAGEFRNEGSTILGNSPTLDFTHFIARITSGFVPAASNTYALGNNGFVWDAFLGDAHINYASIAQYLNVDEIRPFSDTTVQFPLGGAKFGRDDAVAADLFLYGNDADDNPRINLYSAADLDSVLGYTQLLPTDDEFRIRTWGGGLASWMDFIFYPTGKFYSSSIEAATSLYSGDVLTVDGVTTLNGTTYLDGVTVASKNFQPIHITSATDVVTVGKGLQAAHLTTSGTASIGTSAAIGTTATIGTSADVGATGTNLTRLGATANTGGLHGTSLFYDGTYGHLLTVHSEVAWKSFKYEARTHLFYTTGTTLAMTLDSSGNAVFEKNITTKGNVTLGDAATDTATVTGLLYGSLTAITGFQGTVAGGYTTWNGQTTSSTVGWVAPGNGSIITVSGYMDAGSVSCYVYKNGKSVWTAYTSSSAGNFAASPQAKGTDTFIAGDVITIYSENTTVGTSETFTLYVTLDSLAGDTP